MKLKTINLSKKSGTWPATGKNVKYSAKLKMSLLNMSTMITSKRIARTLPVTGMAALGKGNPSKPSICWLYTCVVTLGRSHINAM